MKILFCILLLCFGNGFFAQANDDSAEPVLVWKPIQNVKYYQLQVRNSDNEILIDEKLTETTYTLELEPGKYEHRVGIYNKFNKVSVYTDWTPFTILKAYPPEVTSEKKNYGTKATSTYTLRIEGKKISSKTKVTLKNSSTEFPIISINRSSNTIELILNNEEATVGEYDLILENPRKKILTIEKFYTLNPSETVAENIETKEEKLPEKPMPGETKPEEVKPEETKKASAAETKADHYYPYWQSAARSMILPGWGQFHKEETIKGILFGASLLLSVTYFQSASQDFQSDKKKYNTSINQTFISSSLLKQDQFMYAGFVFNDKYFLEAESSSNRVYQASILVGVIYFANILDALFWRIPQKTAQFPEKQLYFFTNMHTLPANAAYSQQSQSVEIGLKFNF